MGARKDLPRNDASGPLSSVSVDFLCPLGSGRSIRGVKKKHWSWEQTKAKAGEGWICVSDHPTWERLFQVSPGNKCSYCIVTPGLVFGAIPWGLASLDAAGAPGD